MHTCFHKNIWKFVVNGDKLYNEKISNPVMILYCFASRSVSKPKWPRFDKIVNEIMKHFFIGPNVFTLLGESVFTERFHSACMSQVIPKTMLASFF